MINQLFRILTASFVILISGQLTGQAQTVSVLTSEQSQEAAILAQKIHNTYVQGRLAQQEGQLGLAAHSFRAILRVQPSHIPARRALVDILMAAGDFEAAEFHLAYLIKNDPNPQAVSRYYAVQDEIVRKTPFSYSGTFAVSPSTNVNNGTRITQVPGTVFTNTDGLETSGYGLILGGNAAYRWPLGGGQQVELAGSITANWYHIEALQNVVANVSLQYERDNGDAQLSVGPYFRSTMYRPVVDPTTTPNNNALGVSLSYSLQISPQDKISINLRHEYQTHFATNTAGNYKSGPFSSASIQVDHVVDPSLSTFASFGLQRYAPPLSARLAYSGVSFSIGANKLWSSDLMTGITLGIGGSLYDDNYAFWAPIRQDIYYSLTLSVRSSRLKVFDIIPQLSCTYKNNNSNVDVFFTYETTNCNIALIQSF